MELDLMCPATHGKRESIQYVDVCIDVDCYDITLCGFIS